MVAEIAVGKPVHQAVRQRIQQLVGAQLRNTGSAAVAGWRKRRYRNGDRPSQSGGAIGEVDVAELPQLQVISSKIDKESLRRSRRRSSAVYVRGQHAAKCSAQLEANLGGGSTGEHGGAIESAEFRASKRLSIIKNVVGGQVCVVPDTDLGIVVELRGAIVKPVDVVS